MPASLESVSARSNEVAPECDVDGESADGSEHGRASLASVTARSNAGI